ncbi:transthyretin-like family protein [Nocardia sp. NBC_01499]|uniref:hypothetical protein n=1 Tax=Nocardia sp. NBC_01499 TaxID=2903597 RepID=UPI00386EE957
MRHLLSITAFVALGPAMAWLPGTAAAVPFPSNTTHLHQELAMDQQTVSIKGKLLCNGQPSTATQSQVQLVNKRLGQDDVHNGYPADDGTFALTLTVNSTSAITPEVHIHTSCNATPPQQCRLLTLSVPAKYVNSGKPYDMSTINLEIKLNDESSC